MAAEHLAAQLGQWINTRDWAASAEYLTAHAEDLLTDNAEELLVGNVAEQPKLLGYLGLLGVARQLGVEEAHALITDRAARGGARAARPPDERLAMARLSAGLDDGSADAQFAHALAALEAGAGPEAVWAMTRCRDVCASWERPSLARRLDEFADTNPELDLAPLHRALTEEAAS
ncbi:MAG: hypothetical protein ACRDTC_23485 [Pseudonocardiaceae bacterium]